jgi:hypothetical protein
VASWQQWQKSAGKRVLLCACSDSSASTGRSQRGNVCCCVPVAIPVPAVTEVCGETCFAVCL